MSDTAPWEDFQAPDQGPWMDYANPPAPQVGGGISGAIKGASRALEANLPFVDRAVAYAKSKGYGGGTGDYATNLATEQAKNAHFAQQNPWTNAVGGLTASAPLALVPGFEGAGLGGRVASMGLTGGLAGEVGGIASSPDLTNSADVGQRAAQGFGVGGALGSAAPLAGAAVGAVGGPLARALGKAPDVEGLAGQVSGAYTKVKDLGASYSPASVQTLMDKIASDAAEADIDPSLNPKATSILKNLQARVAAKAESGQAVTLPELDKMRQFVNDNLGGLPEPKQVRFGALIKGNIDDFIKNAEPQTALPREASAAPGAAAPPSVGAPAPQRPVNPGGQAPPSLVTFLSRMGVKDEGGDLASMGFGKFPGLIRRGGVPMDEARRAAADAGYMGSDTTVSDFLDEIAKHPTYAQGADTELAARRADYQRGMEDYRRAVDEAKPSQIEEAPSASAAPDVIPPAPTASDTHAAIQNARDLAMRQFKAKALSDALNKAQIRTDVSGTGGNIENATRQRLAAILEKEPWSEDETAQLNKMVHGTLPTNALRQVSRLSPAGNALTLMLEGGGSLATGSPWPAVAAGAGLGAQGAGALMRRNAQNKLLATILAGGKAPVSPSYSGTPTRAALAAALASRQQLQPSGNSSQ